jgi:hypothetical protein
VTVVHATCPAQRNVLQAGSSESRSRKCHNTARSALQSSAQLHCPLFVHSTCNLSAIIHHADTSQFSLFLAQITQVNTIFVTSKLFTVSDIIFYTEFKFVLSFSISRKVFKGHTVII